MRSYSAPILVTAVLLAGAVAPGRALASHEPSPFEEHERRRSLEEQNLRRSLDEHWRSRQRYQDREAERLNRYEVWDETVRFGNREFNCRVTVSGTLVDRHCEPE